MKAAELMSTLMTSRHWPLFDLRMTTSLLTYAYPAEGDLDELIEIVERLREQPGLDWWWENTRDGGELEPFAVRALQRLWDWRSAWRTTKWCLPLMAKLGDKTVGVVEIYSSDFPILRSAEIGIWVDPPLQGKGHGREMSQAALHFAFDMLDADEVRWSSPISNDASMNLAQRLGFKDNGQVRIVDAGKLFEERLFRMDRQMWHEHMRDDIVVTGFEKCRPFFGL